MQAIARPAAGDNAQVSGYDPNAIMKLYDNLMVDVFASFGYSVSVERTKRNRVLFQEDVPTAVKREAYKAYRKARRKLDSKIAQHYIQLLLDNNTTRPSKHKGLAIT